MDQKLVSIIVPFFNEAPNLAPLEKELRKVLALLPYRFEVILVDDGSRDNSANIARKLASKHKIIRFIGLSKNFGKEAAMSAGLHAAKGKAAIIIDADLQMPPSLIGEFLTKWKSGAEVVVGVFEQRKTSIMHKIGSKSFYRIMGAISNTEVIPHATDYRLLDRKVIDAFARFTEHSRITRGLIDWLGFKRDYLYFEQDERRHGTPSYDYKKLISLAVNSFTSNSLMPLRAAGYVGAIILFISLPIGFFMTYLRVINNAPIRGTAFLAILLVALVGLILVCLGLVSLYIANIHTEVADRPLYIVSEDTFYEVSSKNNGPTGLIAREKAK